MRFVFLVQGEGRGHMTQAIALSRMLRGAGHEVSSVVIGKSEQRVIPPFFFEKIGAPVTTVESPNFLPDSNGKGVRVFASVVHNLLRMGRFVKSIRTIRQIITHEKTDVVVNFYELLGGITWLLYKPSSKLICVGHQYLLWHQDFVFPRGHWLDKKLLSINSWITGIGASKYLALAFHPLPAAKNTKIKVVPPLLREEVFHCQSTNQGYIHGYMLNRGYAAEIENWHREQPEIPLHFFWDNREAAEETRIDGTLTFHRINDTKFLAMMAGSMAYCSTAGFESICEAFYLGKPAMIIPTANHFEQLCNSVDAQLAGAGVASDKFDLSRLLAFIPQYGTRFMDFQVWANRARDFFIAELTD